MREDKKERGRMQLHGQPITPCDRHKQKILLLCVHCYLYSTRKQLLQQRLKHGMDIQRQAITSRYSPLLSMCSGNGLKLVVSQYTLPCWVGRALISPLEYTGTYFG